MTEMMMLTMIYRFSEEPPASHSLHWAPQGNSAGGRRVSSCYAIHHTSYIFMYHFPSREGGKNNTFIMKFSLSGTLSPLLSYLGNYLSFFAEKSVFKAKNTHFGVFTKPGPPLPI